MTDAERRTLCDDLRSYGSINGRKAADETERLVALVQSDAEPAVPSWYETHDDKDVMPDKWSMPKDVLTDKLVERAYDIFWHSNETSQSRKSMRVALEFVCAALAQSDAHTDFLSQMRVTEFLGGPSTPVQSNAKPDAMADKEAYEEARRELPYPAADAKPDASAGLIEAADLFDKLRIRHLLDEWFAGPNPMNVDALANVLRLRLARAADRSGPRPDASAELNKARRAAEADFRQRAADRSGK